MKPLFLLRPEPGWSASARIAREMGLEVHGRPLFTIEPVSWEIPRAEDFDGLLVGSANVFRHGGRQLEALTGMPAYVVGAATAAAAHGAGFRIGRAGRGGLQSLLDDLAGHEARLLRLAGEERVVLQVPDGISLDTRIVYRAVPDGLADDDVARLRSGGVVALHSGAAAERFAAECERLCIDRRSVDLAVIGPRVADLAGEGWHSVSVAASPEDSELLALARALCQTGGQ